VEYTQITPDEFTALDGLDDWTVVGNEIHATFRGSTYLDGAQLVTTIAEIAETNQHHPDMEIRYPGRVHVMLTTHATGGLTTLDADIARLISAAADAEGAVAQPHDS